MYLSYSGFKKLDGCAFSYWHEYVNKTETTTVDDRLGSVFGNTIGRLFERFYVEKAWKSDQPQGLVKSWAAGTLDDVLREETSPRKFRKAGVLLWQGQEGATKHAYENREAILEDVLDCVDNGFQIIRRERLLGPRAEAEVKLDDLVQGHKLAGRADFIIVRTRPHNDLTITDGKGSAYGGKYVDKRQLLWYSMLLRERERVLPDRVGFLFWRLTDEESVVWYDVEAAEVDALLQEVIRTIDRFEAGQKTLGSTTEFGAVAEVFVKSPSDDNCKFCPYASQAICPEGFAIAEKQRLKDEKARAKEKETGKKPWRRSLRKV